MPKIRKQKPFRDLLKQTNELMLEVAPITDDGGTVEKNYRQLSRRCKAILQWAQTTKHGAAAVEVLHLLNGHMLRGTGVALVKRQWWPPCHCADCRQRTRACPSGHLVLRMGDQQCPWCQLEWIRSYWSDTEARAADAHSVYQQEAHRRGDVRHPDDYAALTEDVKESDRVLVRWVQRTLPGEKPRTDVSAGESRDH